MNLEINGRLLPLEAIKDGEVIAHLVGPDFPREDRTPSISRWQEAAFPRLCSPRLRRGRGGVVVKDGEMALDTADGAPTRAPRMLPKDAENEASSQPRTRHAQACRRGRSISRSWRRIGASHEQFPTEIWGEITLLVQSAYFWAWMLGALAIGYLFAVVIARSRVATARDPEGVAFSSILVGFLIAYVLSSFALYYLWDDKLALFVIGFVVIFLLPLALVLMLRGSSRVV